MVELNMFYVFVNIIQIVFIFKLKTKTHVLVKQQCISSGSEL